MQQPGVHQGRDQWRQEKLFLKVVPPRPTPPLGSMGAGLGVTASIGKALVYTKEESVTRICGKPGPHLLSERNLPWNGTLMRVNSPPRLHTMSFQARLQGRAHCCAPWKTAASSSPLAWHAGLAGLLSRAPASSKTHNKTSDLYIHLRCFFQGGGRKNQLRARGQEVKAWGIRTFGGRLWGVCVLNEVTSSGRMMHWKSPKVKLLLQQT